MKTLLLSFLLCTIEWISNNRYLLTTIDDSGEEDENDVLEINIFEVVNNTYKYISKLQDGDLYVEGELQKID